MQVLQARGIDKPTLKQVMAEAPELQRTGRPKKGSKLLTLSKSSNDPSRLAARLKRDHPDIVERIDAEVRQKRFHSGTI